MYMISKEKKAEYDKNRYINNRMQIIQNVKNYRVNNLEKARKSCNESHKRQAKKNPGYYHESYLKYGEHTVAVTCIECGKLLLNAHQKHCNDCVKKHNREIIEDWAKNYPQKQKEILRKSNARRRGYGSIELFNNPFPDDIQVVCHHISDAFVVYLPKSLHINHYTGKDKEKHRDELKPYVEGIYDITYTIEEDRFP